MNPETLAVFLGNYLIQSSVALTVGLLLLRRIHNNPALQNTILKFAIFAPIASALLASLRETPVLLAPAYVIAFEPVQHAVTVSQTATVSGNTETMLLPSLNLVASASAVWLAIAAFLLARLAFAHARLHLALHESRLPLSEREKDILDTALAGAALPGKIRFLKTKFAAAPLQAGFRTIALPPEFFSAFSTSERMAILAHEVAHVEQRDNLWKIATGIACAVFFFQPLNWFAARAMSRNAEFAADLRALRKGIRPDVLSRCLISIATSLQTDSAARNAHAMTNGDATLTRRIRNILSPGAISLPQPRRRSFAASLVILATMSLSPVLAFDTATLTVPTPRVFEMQNAIQVLETDYGKNFVAKLNVASRQADGRPYTIAYELPGKLTVLVNLTPLETATRVDSMEIVKDTRGQLTQELVFWLGNVAAEDSERWFNDIYRATRGREIGEKARELLRFHQGNFQ